MSPKYVLSVGVIAAVLLFTFSPRSVRAQGKTASAKALRCTFPLNATGTWSKEGAPTAAVKPSTLVLRFAAINPDEGTAELRNGSVASGVTVILTGGNLHFTQAFRTGPLYLTTVFDKETPGGKLKAVHSRHEYLGAPVEGTTSSPEQYYGECEIVN